MEQKRTEKGPFPDFFCSPPRTLQAQMKSENAFIRRVRGLLLKCPFRNEFEAYWSDSGVDSPFLWPVTATHPIPSLPNIQHGVFRRKFPRLHSSRILLALVRTLILIHYKFLLARERGKERLRKIIKFCFKLSISVKWNIYGSSRSQWVLNYEEPLIMYVEHVRGS